jgi:hypothetical protein
MTIVVPDLTIQHTITTDEMIDVMLMRPNGSERFKRLHISIKQSTVLIVTLENSNVLIVEQAGEVLL